MESAKETESVGFKPALSCYAIATKEVALKPGQSVGYVRDYVSVEINHCILYFLFFVLSLIVSNVFYLTFIYGFISGIKQNTSRRKQ